MYSLTLKIIKIYFLIVYEISTLCKLFYEEKNYIHEYNRVPGNDNLTK